MVRGRGVRSSTRTVVRATRRAGHEHFRARAAVRSRADRGTSGRGHELPAALRRRRRTRPAGAALLLWTMLAGAEATLAEARDVARTPAGPRQLGQLFYELHRHPRRLVISLALGRELALVTAAVLERAGRLPSATVSAAASSRSPRPRSPCSCTAVAPRPASRRGGSRARTPMTRSDARMVARAAPRARRRSRRASAAR